MGKYPLRFRFAGDEWTSRLMHAARLISDRPAFAECSFEDIASFLDGKIASLVEVHLMSSITLDHDPAGWAGYTSHLSINELSMGCDLAYAAYEHLILGHTYSPAQSRQPRIHPQKEEAS